MSISGEARNARHKGCHPFREILFDTAKIYKIIDIHSAIVYFLQLERII